MFLLHAYYHSIKCYLYGTKSEQELSHEALHLELILNQNLKPVHTHSNRILQEQTLGDSSEEKLCML